MRYSYLLSAVTLVLYASGLASAATIARRRVDASSIVARDYGGNYVLVARGNSISMYTDFEKDIKDLEAAENAGDESKAKKINERIEKGLKKQDDSIRKLDEKSKKALDKEIAKAEKIRTKLDAASQHFNDWIAKLNSDPTGKKKKRELVRRGNSISMYTDFEKDIKDLEAAENAGDESKAKKINERIEKGLKKQDDSIRKLDEKSKKALDKEIAKAEKIRTKLDAASQHFNDWIAKLNSDPTGKKKKRELVRRGNSISMYTDFEKDIKDLEAAENAGDESKAKKINERIEKGLKKQDDSIRKLDEKSKKALDKEIAKAEKIRTKLDAASQHFNDWIAKLNSDPTGKKKKK